MSHVEHFPLMLAGSNKRNDHQIEVTSPYDDHLIATVETSEMQDVDVALETAQSLFSDREKWIPVAERIAILERAVALMEEQSDSLAKGSAEEGGKPLLDSQVEMIRCIDSIRLCADTLRHDVAKPVPMAINTASQHRFTMMNKEPIGVVVAVSAFNHPLNLIAHQVGPAIATG